MAGTPKLIRTGKPLFGENYFDYRSKVDTSRRFHEFLVGMGDGGAAPTQVEIGEDDARDPTDEFIERGEKFRKF